MLIKTPLLHQSLDSHVCLSFFIFLSFSLSLYFWLIPWNVKASCKTQGMLASFLLSLSHPRLWTTRFQSSKGPTLSKGLSTEWVATAFYWDVCLGAFTPLPKSHLPLQNSSKTTWEAVFRVTVLSKFPEKPEAHSSQVAHFYFSR